MVLNPCPLPVEEDKKIAFFPYPSIVFPDDYITISLVHVRSYKHDKCDTSISILLSYNRYVLKIYLHLLNFLYLFTFIIKDVILFE